MKKVELLPAWDCEASYGPDRNVLRWANNPLALSRVKTQIGIPLQNYGVCVFLHKNFMLLLFFFCILFLF